MSHYRTYPEYKDSGIKWMSKLPQHWDIKRLRYVAMFSNSNVDKKTYHNQATVQLCNYTDVYYNEFIRPEMDFMAATASPSEIKKFELKIGDVIITKDSEDSKDIGIPSLVTENMPGVVCGYHLTVIRAKNLLHARFLHRLLQSDSSKAHFFVESPGITRFGLNQYSIGDVPIGMPSDPEIQGIVDFLDRETTRIDTLIEKKTRFIELLKEKRQALITHAVSKGLDPHVEMKDSGVDWIGDMPAHWRVMGLTKCIGPIVDYRGRTPTKVDEGQFLVTAKNVREGKLDYECSKEYVDPRSAQQLLERGRPEVGDLLFTMEAPLGQVAQIDRTDIALAQRIVKFRAVESVLKNEFLLFWIMGSYCQAVLETLSTGSTALGIKASKLGMITVFLPPDDEQIEIIRFLRAETTTLDRLREKVELSITLLKERRSSLITAAVTGQIDLREYSA